MSLDLKRVKKASGGTPSPDGEAGEPARAPSELDIRGAPPPVGSCYDAFVDWASGGSPEPFDDDVKLAMEMWLQSQSTTSEITSAPSFSP